VFLDYFGSNKCCLGRQKDGMSYINIHIDILNKQEYIEVTNIVDRLIYSMLLCT